MSITYSTFLDLPLDLQEFIAEYLPVCDRANLSRACTRLYHLLQERLTPTQYRIRDTTTPDAVDKLAAAWTAATNGPRSLIFDVRARPELVGLVLLEKLLPLRIPLQSLTISCRTDDRATGILYVALRTFVQGYPLLQFLELDIPYTYSNTARDMRNDVLFHCKSLTEFVFVGLYDRLTHRNRTPEGMRLSTAIQHELLTTIRCRGCTDFNRDCLVLLMQRDTLRHIELTDCSSTFTWVGALTDIAERCTQLITFSLEDYNLQIGDPAPLLRLLERNPSLRQVVLGTSNIISPNWRLEYDSIAAQAYPRVFIAIRDANYIGSMATSPYGSGVYRADTNSFPSILRMQRSLEWKGTVSFIQQPTPVPTVFVPLHECRRHRILCCDIGCMK